MPLTTPSELVDRYKGDPDHFAHVLDHLFVPAIEQAGFTAKKPIAEGADLIHAEIVRNLENADLVLCDISALNANVFFEFGIRTALDRPICLVRDDHTKLPFDIGGINCHSYASSLTPWDTPGEIQRLTSHIEASSERADGHNPLWRHFGLTQRGTDAINAVPGDDQSAAMRLILDEIQQMRREVAPVDKAHSSRVSSEQIFAMLDDLGISWSSGHRGENRMGLELDEPRPSKDLLKRAQAEARKLGVDLTFD